MIGMINTYYVATEKGRGAMAEYERQTARSTQNFGWTFGWKDEQSGYFATWAAVKYGCFKHQNNSDADLDAALYFGYIREASKEEVLVHTLRSSSL